MKIGDLIQLNAYGRQFFGEEYWSSAVLVIGHGEFPFQHTWKLLYEKKIGYISIFNCDKSWNVISSNYSGMKISSGKKEE